MLAIATKSIVKLVAFLAVGVFVTFCDVRRAGRHCSRRRCSSRTPPPCSPRGRRSARSLAMTLLSFFAIMLLPRQFHVTVVENNNEAEIRRAAWMFPLYLVLINLFVVPIAHRRPADVPGRRTSTATCSCWRCRCRPAPSLLTLARLRRRPVGRDRDGDRRNGRALDHGVERHRHAARAQAPRGAIAGRERRRRAAAHGAPARDLRDPAARLPLLPLGRRRAARLHRPAVVRRRRAARAGVLRRPDLAARHRARRASPA